MGAVGLLSFTLQCSLCVKWKMGLGIANKPNVIRCFHGELTMTRRSSSDIHTQDSMPFFYLPNEYVIQLLEY